MENATPDPIVPDADPLQVEAAPAEKRRLMRAWVYPLLVVASFMVGLLIGNLAWGRQPRVSAAAGARATAATQVPESHKQAIDVAALIEEVNPEQGFTLPVSYGDLGPALVKSGAIDYKKLAAVYVQGGDPLTPSQIEILKQGSTEPIVITSANAHFLLNFFWAVGLANQNSILTAGPITTYSEGRVEQFASTGGWTLGSKPVKELFASTKLIELTPEQQARVEEVAGEVYRPCCDNPTLFPDCNHGMAMLGLLELMASKGASIDEMLTAAKDVNAFWFPQQTLETAIYLKVTQDVGFAQADPRTAIGKQLSSGSGSGQLHSALQAGGFLPDSQDGGGGCGT